MTAPPRVGPAGASPLTLPVARRLSAAGHRLTACVPSCADATHLEETGIRRGNAGHDVSQLARAYDHEAAA
ncbi:hypothetical protein ACFRI7_33985 [Streptomyces sp. NPDC056716]|uniref:hypothetical protein n=1 Tax=unclassified Streptomyces TaxID=2593676 RepID=UPI0036822638